MHSRKRQRYIIERAGRVKEACLTITIGAAECGAGLTDRLSIKYELFEGYETLNVI